MLRLFALAALLAATFAVITPTNFGLPNGAPKDSKLWVLIVAGSNEWYNYRHQSDAYHAYQIVRRHGVPPEQIVLMAYDDIANNPENPTKGIVINHPNGTDVFKGVVQDYTKDTVTPDNFLKILQGDAKSMKGIGSGKVIASGPNDYIFVNFVDHGAPGLVAFPEGELYAKDLNAVIKKMYSQKKYKEMVFYIEACESGSMFDGLLKDNLNVFATTASNPDESSYACYFDDLRQTYLGDVYSVNWMEDSDKSDLNSESLQQQFKIVKKETNTSHVMEYGNLTIAKESVATYQGKKKAVDMRIPKASQADAIPSEHVYIDLLERKVSKASNQMEREYWQSHLNLAVQKRDFLVKTTQKIVSKVADTNTFNFVMNGGAKDRLDEDGHECLGIVGRAYSSNCFSFSHNDFALFFAPKVLASACMKGVPAEALVKAIMDVCTHSIMTGIH